jgi:hypothetical protein
MRYVSRSRIPISSSAPQRKSGLERLSQNGQSFTAIARVTVFDPDGNVVGSFTATASGKRMQVERIPDQP